MESPTEVIERRKPNAMRGSPRPGLVGSRDEEIMATLEMLDRGRECFARGAWADACAHLRTADQQSALAAEDLERLATAAYLAGLSAESESAWARAHTGHLSRGRVERAVRCAFWLAFALLNRGERARAGGWLARGRRLVAEIGKECAERGYLLVPDALGCIAAGDLAGADAALDQAAAVGDRLGDRDLVALARHSQGRVRIRMGKVREGMTLLDEAMAAVEAGEISPMVAGDVYCSMIEGCLEVFDVARARQWTAALSGWCEAQPDLMAYRGQCLARRAEILQLQGDWLDAMDEAQRACDCLARPPAQPALGAALYQQAELHRLRGDFVQAEEGYREASRWGRKPEPGLAQLRLAQGQAEAAGATIHRALEETRDPRARARLLPAHVEITLARGDVEQARAAADELATIAAALDAPLLNAVADQARGAVLLAEQDPHGALHALRQAWRRWQELGAPYHAARARVLIALACRELADHDAADMELHGARCAFQQLGAVADLAGVEALSRHTASGPDHGLTPRQLQVLRRVCAGETNRAIASRLFISERTVDRHVSNILSRLGVGSRAAATAYAYEHGLVQAGAQARRPRPDGAVAQGIVAGGR